MRKAHLRLAGSHCPRTQSAKHSIVDAHMRGNLKAEGEQREHLLTSANASRGVRRLVIYTFFFVHEPIVNVLHGQAWELR